MEARETKGGRYTAAGLAYFAGVLLVTALMIVMTNLEARYLGRPASLQFWMEPGPMAAANILRQLTRAVITILALTVTVTGIAVPLTANLYTPRLLELFVRDRVNILFFLFLTLAGIFTHFGLYVIRDVPQTPFVPNVFCIWAIVLGLACIPLTGPFVLYMFRFLSPRVIVGKMSGEVVACLESSVERDSDQTRARVSDMVEQFTEIAARAVSRHDAVMTGAVLDQIGRIAARYRELKPKLPESWFWGDPAAKLTTPKRAIALLREERTWFEFALLRSLEDLMQQVMKDMPEVSIRVARIVRRIAAGADKDGDALVVDLALRYLNTFLRMTITGRQVRAFYYCSWEYRRLAEDFAETNEERLVEIARLLEHYGGEAEKAGLVFATQVALYDLADILLLARESKLCSADLVLAVVLGAARDSAVAPVEPLVKVLAQSLAAGHDDLVVPIASLLTDLPAERVAAAVGRVLAAEQQRYHEITARVTDLNWVPEDARAALRSWWDGHRAQTGRGAPEAAGTDT